MKKLDYGFAFLEKFVQLSFSVPKPSEKTLEIFLKEFSSDKQQNPQEKQSFLKPLVLFIGKKFKSVKIRLHELFGQQNPGEEKETTTQDNSHTTSETTERPELPIFPLIQKEPTSKDITKLVKKVAPLFDYNPRRLKQYLNVLRLRSYITYYAIGVIFEERNSLTIEQLGKFVAITLKYPRLLRRLEEDSELLGKLAKCAQSQDSSSNNSNESHQSSESTTNNGTLTIFTYQKGVKASPDADFTSKR